jgi:hypothetical protein
MAKKEKGEQSEVQWVKETLATFEKLHPGLTEKLSIMATQHQVRISIYPQQTTGGASASAGEQT